MNKAHVALEVLSTTLLGASQTRLLERLAPSPHPILVEGETGTGKELAARLLHQRSGRRGGLYALRAAGAGPELHQVLVGHVAGAFSGALEPRDGVLAAADGGTLLLDGVDELPPSAQVALARILESRSYRPLGATSERQAEVRIIATSRRPLLAQVAAGAFQRSTYDRLAALKVSLPPLRERGAELSALTAALLKECDLPPLHDRSVLPLLAAQPWPGNLRELGAVLRASGVLAQGRRLTVREVHEALQLLAGLSETERYATLRLRHRCAEAAFLRGLVNQLGGRGAAAHALGMSRHRLARLLTRLESSGAVS